MAEPAIRADFATTADLPAMADLLTELFALESDFTPDRSKQLAGLRLILDTPALGRLFVLRKENDVVGMANALITISSAEGCRVLLLEDVIVRNGFRGRNLGRRLVEHVCTWAADEGMSRVTLLADKDNTHALHFYARLGFLPSNMRVLRKSLT